ncbi:MAG: hypothetical protein MK076_05135 [Flavobacteriales bacterium]|nr:hypothetical protein [Flavobacteriales bacterium]
MDTQNHSLTIRITKEGKKPFWHEMKTVADIFQLACKLNKKQRKKMFKDFAQMNEVSVLYKKACDELIEEDSKLEVEIFRWSK